MTNLVSTYRIQFHKEYSFEDFEKDLPYLQKLGVGTIYASPIFKSVPGSNHGYDGLDPNEINSEVGSAEKLSYLSKQLKAADIYWLQDIVPNHMAFHQENNWLMDVLEKGPQSIYAGYFDTVWSDPFYKGRLMVPFLGSTVDEVIERNELTIAFQDGFVFKYFDAAYPLQPLSYATIFNSGPENPPTAIRQLLSQMPKEEDENAYGKAVTEFKMQLTGLMKNEAVNEYVGACLDAVNNNKDLIHTIEAQQSYQLCHWHDTDNEINYRRFFTVNGLICINIQDEYVFEQYHMLVQKLLAQGIFQGLRIDHIDGLYDPGEYLHRLRALAGEDVPIFVEKILEPGEALPKQWPVQGNTGYDFLSLVNNLFTNQHQEIYFTRYYRKLVNDPRPVHELVTEKKSAILYEHMAGELENLFRLFVDQNFVEKKTLSSVRPEELKEVIAEFLIHCPVYRFYGSSFPLDKEEGDAVKEILDVVKKYNPELQRATAIFYDAIFGSTGENQEEHALKLAHFYKRCMQFTGPLMAKGVEDTLMYTYNRFIAHNEVGDAPDSFGISAEAFHEAMTERQQLWPFTLNATSTHDTKRGEDVRARLNVLSDLGEQWFSELEEWDKLNESLLVNNGPDKNDRYFIYQTLIGAHPFPGEDMDDFSNRINIYLQKALREGKVNSGWADPNEEYEKAAQSFAGSLLDVNNPFYNRFIRFQKTIVDHGIVNSLSQLMLKFTCPGIPDVYQGCELWDLSLVDPDNRRAVDYNKRMEWLASFGENVDILQLWEERYNGRIKLWLTRNLFRLRRQLPQLFTAGEYVPLKIEGTYSEHIIAFARIYRRSIIVIAVPLHTAIICKEQAVDVPGIDWKDTTIEMPDRGSEEWELLLSATTIKVKKQFRASTIFNGLPFAIIKGYEPANERGAGLLLHISSLPSPFGIGDMGPEARMFAGFLQRSSQKYWQLLPLNPTEEGQGHSPYSSISSRAGNVLFISPELLVKDGLLSREDIQQVQVANKSNTDFAHAEKIKEVLLDKAWQNFVQQESHFDKNGFHDFEEREKEWLDDFALYVLLKKKNGDKPWFEWKRDYKFHDPQALTILHNKNEAEIRKIKWFQFIFSGQWHGLRDFCNQSGIQLIGDIPFYISYDSADVWSNRHLFALDEEGNKTGMAGVPPDAFSALGQLWGMPVFNWEKHKEENYAWWINRLKKNIEWFDLVRLDHFRAFSAYWEVPAGEATAKNGEWKPGPGENFFESIKTELGSLPFVAEDLGEIDETVYQLRDSYQLPGMKVLQFAFGSDMNRSVHIPHNYQENFIVYTGTHDNNTTRGWFTTEAGEDSRLALEKYIGRPVSSAEVSLLLARMAYASVARIAILPLQDVLNLDDAARMNTPASVENNWSWRLQQGQVNNIAEKNLREWTRLFNRE